MNFIIAQIIGVITAIIAFSCVQFKDERILLAGQFLSNALTAVNLGLLGSISGAWICLLATIQTVIIFFLNKDTNDTKQKIKKIISIIFAVAYVAGTFVTYTAWSDIVVCTCALLFTLTVFQEDSGKMRSIIIANMSLWVIYDLAVGAYTNILTHGLTLISTVTAKMRLDR